MNEKLKAEMKRQGITGYRLSKTTGINASDLYSALKGNRPMFPKWKALIAEALNCPIEVLFPVDEEEVSK